ncbi:hypothetical protein V5O48_012075 [Marasmius crinis-equi]|uniref:Uncharacterized protein n=1 Tax=Marasmius crinis-equi TaxID=585013 RepID=A0ABR3F464_9AGAR
MSHIALSLGGSKLLKEDALTSIGIDNKHGQTSPPKRKRAKLRHKSHYKAISITRTATAGGHQAAKIPRTDQISSPADFLESVQGTPWGFWWPRTPAGVPQLLDPAREQGAAKNAENALRGGGKIGRVK